MRGGAFVVEGEFLMIAASRELAYTWNASWSPGVTATVRIVLQPRNGGTWLTWTMSGFEGHPDALENHAMGLPGVVGWLRAYFEAGHKLKRAPLGSVME